MKGNDANIMSVKFADHILSTRLFSVRQQHTVIDNTKIWTTVFLTRLIQLTPAMNESISFPNPLFFGSIFHRHFPLLSYV